MLSDGYADHDPSTHVSFNTEVWPERSGEHGMSGEWLWAVSETVYNYETEENEERGLADGFAQSESEAQAMADAALRTFKAQ